MKLNTLIRQTYGKSYDMFVILLSTLAFVTAGAQFIVTYCMGRVIDAVSMGHERTMYYFLIIVSALMIFIGGSALLSFGSGKMTARFVFRMQNRIAKKICMAQYRDIETVREGELLAITTKDVEGVKNWLEALLKAGCLPMKLGVVLLVLFQYHWKFSLFMVCLIPLSAIPEMMIARKLHSYHAEEKAAYADVLSFFTGALAFAMIIKSFCLEQLFQKKNQEGLQQYKRARMKRVLGEQLVDVYSRFFGHTTNCLILMVGAYFILEGEFSLGTLTSIILLADYVGEGLKVLNALPVHLQEGRAGMAHIQTLMQLQDACAHTVQMGEAVLNEGKNTIHKIEAALELEQDVLRIGSELLSEPKPRFPIPVYEVRALSFQYGDAAALHDVNFCVQEREKIAVVGPSGCGKTTLFKLLCGLYTPEQKRIFFRGKDAAWFSNDALRKQVTVVAQETFLFHASFRDNITVANPDAVWEMVDAAGKKAQIDKFIRTLPAGYDTIVDTTVFSISNGQMQRINLARAFLKDTDVLLLDEPTSALDPQTTKLVLDALFSAYTDRTILMIVHNMQEIYRFDKVLIIEGGRVAGFGRHAELLEECESYRKMYCGERGT